MIANIFGYILILVVIFYFWRIKELLESIEKNSRNTTTETLDLSEIESGIDDIKINVEKSESNLNDIKDVLEDIKDKLESIETNTEKES